MAKGVIGRPFTFVALFSNSQGSPVDPLNPVVEIWYYDTAGIRFDIIPAGTALMPQSPPKVGWYTRTVTLPGSLTPDLQVYALMQGEDPVTGDTLAVWQEVDLFAEENPAGSGASVGGLRFDFVKPGQ